MAIKQYIEAILPDQYVVLGVPLKPFCLGHYYHLLKYDIKVSSEGEITTEDIPNLLAAVVICSRTYEDFKEFMSKQEEAKEWYDKWDKVLATHFTKDNTIIDHIIYFREYLRHGITEPKYWILQEGDGADETSESTHWSDTLEYVLTKELGYTPSQALNMPLSEALMKYYRYLARNKVIEFMSEDIVEEVT